jgi:uncharacterized protein
LSSALSSHFRRSSAAQKRGMPTLILLTLSNIFMTVAWYWHLKGGPEVAGARPLGWVILLSWLLAGVEYSLAVPANRIGYLSGWTPASSRSHRRR